MLINSEDDEKHMSNGNGSYTNGTPTNDAYHVSLLEREEKHSKPASHSTRPLEVLSATPFSNEPPSKAILDSIPAVHRPFLFLLCLCSFFATFRPSEPYLTPYLIDDKGLGADAVNERVYPTWTYCYFAFLLPTGVLGEVVGYRPLIVAQLVSLLLTYAVLIWAEGLQWMQFMQVTFGFSSAVQSCVFFTYVYRCSPVEIYPLVVMLGAVVGQMLVWTHHPLWELFIPTLTAVGVALTAFLFLPSQQSQQKLIDAELTGSTDHSDTTAIHAPPAAPPISPSFLFSSLRSVLTCDFSPLAQLWSLLASQYRDPTVRTFSCYLMLGYSVQELVLNYDTTLFYTIAPSASLNGIVVGAGWLIGALAAYFVSVRSVVQAVSRHRYVALSVLPLAASGLLLWSSVAQSVELAYILFIAFYGIMAFLLCVSYALIASNMSVGTFAFLFSVNTFGSLLVQTLVQLIIGERVLLLDIREKYQAFAGQLLFVAVLFGAIGFKQRVDKATQSR